MSRGPIKSALWPLQQAIVSRLESDTILMAMITAVYDEVEEGAVMPYVSIGDDTTNPYDTKTDYGEDTTLTLHAWSAGPGKTEAKKIMDAVLQAITAAPIELTGGFKVDGIEREFLETFNDGQAYHGVCRFRVYIKQL
jgi:hypothetical protein